MKPNRRPHRCAIGIDVPLAQTGAPYAVERLDVRGGALANRLAAARRVVTGRLTHA